MAVDDEAATVVAALEALRIEYALTGSFASNFHGVPRATRDMDLVVNWRGGDLEALTACLEPGFALDPQASFETVTGSTRHLLRSSRSPFTVELFSLRPDDAHDCARFDRRLRVEALGVRLWVMSAEDVVVTKLRWASAPGRQKDLSDAQGILAMMGDAVDLDYVRGWCHRHGTIATLEALLAALEPR
jgi:hypothetical protein